MNWLFLLLSMVPGIEARGSSIYFLCSDQLWLVPVTVVLNFIAVMIFVKVLDMGHVPGRIEGFLERRAEKYYKRVDSWFHRYGNLALFLLIALPSTGIGSFTGAFIGKAFDLRGKVFYVFLLLGIACSLVISFAAAYFLDALYISCVF